MCENDPRNHPPMSDRWEAFISGGPEREARSRAIWEEASRRLQEGRD